MGVGANHGDRLCRAEIERRHTAFVLEQRNRSARRIEGQRAVRVAAHHAIRFLRVHIRVVEQAHAELPEQHGFYQLIEFLLFQHTLAHQFDQVQVTIRLRQLDVDAGAHGKCARFLLVLGDEVAVSVGPVAELPDRVVVGHHEALEAPLLAQNVSHQPAVGVGRHAINLVVGRHHADGSGLVKCLLEREQEGPPYHALGDVRWCAVHARFRLAVAGHVFQRGDDARFVPEGGVALKSTHGRNAHPRGDVRILAVGLFHAPPARVSRHIHHRRQRLVGAAQPRLESRHGEQRLYQLRVEAGAQRDRLREAGATDSRMTVETLLVKEHRDAQTAVLDEELLDGIGQLRHPARILAAARIAGPADLADAAPLPESLLRLGQIEVAIRVHQLGGLLLPDAHHLGALLFQRHSRQQIAYAPGGGHIALAEQGHALALALGRSFHKLGLVFMVAGVLVETLARHPTARPRPVRERTPSAGRSNASLF